MLDNAEGRSSNFRGKRRILPGFTSYKTIAPINYRGRWPRDALIQATLDPSITRILPWSGPPVGAPDLAAAFIRVIDGRSVLTLLREEQGPHQVAAEAFNTVAFLTRQEIHAEPRLTACRSIWSLRERHVSPPTIVQILQTLAESNGASTLQTLASAASGRDDSAIEAVLTLACTGLLQVWAGDGLTNKTRVALSQPLTDNPGLSNRAFPFRFSQTRK